MPFELDWEARGVYKRLSGFVSGDEFVRSVCAIQGDARFDAIHYIINDFSAVTGYALPEDVLTEVSALQYGAHATNPNYRIVYITADAGLAGLVETHFGKSQDPAYETVVLPTLAEAREWLENQPDLFEVSDWMGYRRL